MIKPTQRVLPLSKVDEQVDLPADAREEVVESVAVLLLQILDVEKREEESDDGQS